MKGYENAGFEWLANAIQNTLHEMLTAGLIYDILLLDIYFLVYEVVC